MASQQNGSEKTGWWRRPRAWWLFGIPLGGFVMFVAGIIFLGTFNTAMSLTNTEAFCISCHEMRAFVYEEYKQTIHYSNRTGVRATCPDCHVPKQWHYKVKRKIQATFKELPGHLLGTISTREKFEAKRAELAQHVWEEMRENDSRECRNCHDEEHMNLEIQSRRAQRRHDPEYLTKTGKTCIDCHEGVAHELPDLADLMED